MDLPPQELWGTRELAIFINGYISKGTLNQSEFGTSFKGTVRKHLWEIREILESFLGNTGTRTPPWGPQEICALFYRNKIHEILKLKRTVKFNGKWLSWINIPKALYHKLRLCITCFVPEIFL